MTDDNENKLTTNIPKQLIIENINGRNQITHLRSILKGKVSGQEVFNSVLMAARVQSEKYLEKLARGAPLDASEIKALRQLAEIALMDCTKNQSPPSTQIQQQFIGINSEEVKQQALRSLLSSLPEPK